jgi:hypothetical protein
MTMNRITVAIITMLASISMGQATNRDESKVPSYVLPDVMARSNGEPVTTAQQWRTERRGELLSLFKSQMFGQAPGRPEVKVTTQEVELDALDGLAIRKQMTLRIGDAPDSPELNLLIYLPKKAALKAPGSVPVFLGLNFQGNHTIHTDPGIRLCRSWLPEKRQATEASRGKAASRWPVEMILAQGFGLATLYYGDIDPDFHDEFKNGVHALYPELQQRTDNFSSIGAWAWGLSLVMDTLEKDPHINTKKVAVIGHSRLGKTALWAGATDERFALVISNDSGSGGAALFRRCFGERVHNLNKSFPHWFCKQFKRYDNQEHTLPFDQHMLIALMAPRPVYVASASLDTWADPRGEFLAAHGANPVYRLFGHVGLPSDQWPEPDHPVRGRIGYHVRTGKHDLTAYDWAQYMAFAERQWSGATQ